METEAGQVTQAEFSFDGMSLDAARKIVRDGMDDGVECPCCDQYCKLYKRGIHTSMARFLIWLYRTGLGEPDRRFFHIGEWPTSEDRFLSAGDAAKLRYWELIAEKPKDPNDTTRRTSGYWRITERGIAFVCGELRVPAHVFLFDGRVQGWDEETITIRDALGKNFNYAKLMGWRHDISEEPPL